MGVKNLWDILESCKKTLPLNHLQNKRVCVDLSCWVVQLQNVYKSHCPLKDKLFLKGLFHRIRALIALNCSLIFVTDGSIPAIKLSAYRRRLNAGNEPIQDTVNPPKGLPVKRNMGSEFSCMIKEAKFLGAALGIPCLDGIEEGEAQCALLNSESLCDGCFTSDSDAFLFGARTIYRDICLGEGGYVVCYEMGDIERKLGFGRNSLITLAILLGSDYNQGVRGFGPDLACQLVKSIGDSAVLHRFATEGLSITKKKKKSTKKSQNSSACNKENTNGNKCDLPLENQFLQVINAYLKPKCHSADSGLVHRVLGLYPFNRSQLHHICAQYLDWPHDKTDEYILPKIAERNLRRYHNLRSTSSVLGVHLPVLEMPVKCPVSSIVKQRKVQGRDYFEVSWEDMDGLKASVVPADLVESACPEKIMEFLERKAQKKKPTNKSKQQKIVERDDIDRKLQELMLDIERDSCTMTNGARVGMDYQRKVLLDSESRQKKIVEANDIGRKLQELMLNMERDSCTMTNASHVGMDYQRRMRLDSESEKDNIPESEESNNGGGSMGYVLKSSSGCSRSMGTGIIDLTSPPPRDVLKRQVPRGTYVIELSDSESDTSPEHLKKVRELRVFIANIRLRNS